MGTSTATQSETGLRGLRGRRDFWLFYIGHSASVLGDSIVPVALAFAVLDLTDSSTALGIVLAARVVPTVLLLLVGGVIADRISRRRLMLLCDMACFSSQAIQAVLLLSGQATLASMVLLQLVAGTASAFFEPASSGLLPEIVKSAELHKANGLISVSKSTARMLGPVLAGLLVAWFSPGIAFAVDAASFAVSALALYAIRNPQRPISGNEIVSILEDLRLGWGEFRSRTWLWTMVLWAASFHLLVLPAWQVFGPSVARNALGGASAWAAIAACSGAGAVLGGIAALRMNPRYILRASFIPLGLFGLQLLAIATTSSVLLISAAALVSNIGLAMFNVFSQTAIQRHVPIEAMSRVSSYDWLGSIALLPVGQMLVGPAAAHTSMDLVLMFGAAWMFITPAILFVVRSARSLEAHPKVSLKM